MLKGKYDVILLEMPGEEGLVRNNIDKMFMHFPVNAELYPLEVGNPNDTSTAMGFITREASDKLDFDHREIKKFLGSVLNDMSLENEDCTYEFSGLRIWMGRNLI